MQRFLRLLLHPSWLVASTLVLAGCGGDATSTQEATDSTPRSEVSIVRPGDPPPPSRRPAPPAEVVPESAPDPDEDAAVRAARDSVARAEQALAAARAELARAEARASSEGLPDPLVFREVQRMLLEDPALGHVAIAAEVNAGVVTLRGAVPDASTAEAAIELSEAIRGVQGVRSELRLAN